MKICFLVGSMAVSGGTYVIVQHASFLRDAGHEVTLAVQEPFAPETLVWHDEAPKLRALPFEDAKREQFDLVIATWWKTALELGNFRASRHAYFIQSIESRFYPEHEGPLRRLVDSTYTLPVPVITEASWIKAYLQERYGHEATLARNGIRKDVYSAVGKAVEARPKGSPRVLIEGPFGVSFKNTALALRLAKRAGAKDIWLLTSSPARWIPGVSRVFSRIPIGETAAIYRSCDILIKLSTVEGMFGPPLEIFHCGGTALVFDVSGHDEYIRHNENAVVVPAGNTRRVVEELRALLRDRTRLEALKDGAKKTAAEWPAWPVSSQQFAGWVAAISVGPETDAQQLKAISESAFAEYVRDEQARLAAMKQGFSLRGLLRKLARRAPRRVVRAVKSFEHAGEVLFGGQRVG